MNEYGPRNGIQINFKSKNKAKLHIYPIQTNWNSALFEKK